MQTECTYYEELRITDKTSMKKKIHCDKNKIQKC